MKVHWDKWLFRYYNSDDSGYWVRFVYDATHIGKLPAVLKLSVRGKSWCVLELKTGMNLNTGDALATTFGAKRTAKSAAKKWLKPIETVTICKLDQRASERKEDKTN